MKRTILRIGSALLLVLLLASCGSVSVDAVGPAIWPDYSDITPQKPGKPGFSDAQKATLRRWASEDRELFGIIQGRSHGLEAWGDKLAAILDTHNGTAAAHNAELLERVGVKDPQSVAKLESALAALKKKKGIK